MKHLLEQNKLTEEIKDEILATFSDEVTSEELIAALVRTIQILSIEFPDPERILDEVVRLLEEEG